MASNKKVLSKAVSELGKAKAPAKPRDIITDPAGQWKYPGKKTRIPGSKITMKGVNTALWAQPNIGPGKLLVPNENHDFGDDVSYVDETPIGKKGGTLKSKKYSKSMSATNKLFAKNKLFQNKKSKIFDPNAKFQDGGVSSLEGDLISKVLMNRNKDKDFVQRAFALGENPGTPMFNVFEPEQFGQNMSHKMGWGTDDNGQAWMYPTVLNPTNEAIPVPNQYADYISSQGYKNATGMNEYQDGGESDYKELKLTDKEIEEYRKRGYVVEELQEFPDGGEFTYKGNPGATYKKEGDTWLIKNKNTNNKYVPIQDPTGKRTEVLNKQAVPKTTFKRDIKDQDAQSDTEWSSAPVEKNKVQPTAKQKQAQQAFNKDFKTTGKSKYEKTEDAIANEQQKLIEFSKEKGIPITKQDLENVANQQWSFAGVGPQKQSDMMQATPEQSNSSRAWEYITNPMTAAKYAISGGGAENMPHNINEMRMAGIEPDENNLVGNMLNNTLNLFDAGDKVVRNFSRGNYGAGLLEASRFIPGSGLLDDAVKLGIKPGAKYLNKTLGKKLQGIPVSSTTTTPVKAGFGNMDASRYEIKNPNYYTQLLDTYTNKTLSPTSKKFYKNLIETIKKQDGIVTERQFNELQRLKSGNFNFGKKAYSGLSPELMKNTIGPKNKVGASLLDTSIIPAFFLVELTK